MFRFDDFDVDLVKVTDVFNEGFNLLLDYLLLCFVECDQVLFSGFIRHLAVSYLDVYLNFVDLVVLLHNFWEVFYLAALDQLILIKLNLSDSVFKIVHLVDLLSLGSVVRHARIVCAL